MNKLNARLKPGLLLLVFCFLASAAGLLRAGAPLKVNFQGRLEESGQPAEGAKSFVFRIYDAVSAGTLVWTSQAQSVAVTNGVFSVLLETGTPVNLSTGVFSGARYVEITVDGVPLSPRQEMVSAPYALVAQALAPDAVIPLSSLEKDPSSVSVINTPANAVDWTQLKNVPAGLADGTDDGGGTAFSTAAIVSGKFSDERVSISTGAFYGGFNAAYQLVQLDPSGNLPALDGSALLNVNSAPMSALTAQVNNVAASTGTLTANLAAVVLSTGPLANSGAWSGSLSVGGAVTLPIVKISGTGYNSALKAYALGAGHRTVVADTTADNIFVSLPDAAGVTGRIYTVKNFNPSLTVYSTYIITFAGQTIDDNQVGGPPLALSGKFDTVTLQSDGFNWVIIN